MTVVGFFSKGTSISVQDNWEQKLRLFLPSIKLVPLFSKEALNVTIALLWKAPMERVNELKNIKGLISLGQGVDHILHRHSIPKNITIVRIVDPYMAKSMSHWVLLAVLNFIRDTYGYYHQEKIKKYQPREERNFLTIEIAIYGVGAIGTVVAKDLNQMGFKVNGWSRTEKKIKGVTCYHGESGFSKLIMTCDVHICLLPLTSSTKNIFNNTTFKKMKYGSCFINAGRGDHVVEEDLLENCKSGQVSNAILDVYRHEPLPNNHNFWEQENIRLWPHVAAETNPETAAKQIANAIKCINNNISPPNTINRNFGY